MTPSSGPAAGASHAARQQATAALRTLTTVLQNSLAQYDQAVQRSAELSALASAVQPATPPVRHMFKTEPGQLPRLVLVRGAATPDEAEATYTPFATALAQRNAHLIQNASRALDLPATSSS